MSIFFFPLSQGLDKNKEQKHWLVEIQKHMPLGDPRAIAHSNQGFQAALETCINSLILLLRVIKLVLRFTFSFCNLCKQAVN